MTCRKIIGALNQQLTTYMYKVKRKKYLRSSHIDGKRKIIMIIIMFNISIAQISIQL